MPEPFQSFDARTVPLGGPMPFASTMYPSAAGIGPPGGSLDSLVAAILPIVSQYMLQSKSVFGETGGFGFTFGGDRGVLDSYLARDAMQRRMSAMGVGAEGDAAAMSSIFRGLRLAMGVKNPFSEAEMGMTNRMAESMRPMLPLFAAMFPDEMNQVFGTRGSGAVAAGNVFMANRYLVDAAGRQGGLDSGQLTKALLDRLYGEGGTGRMAGLDAGRGTAAFEEFTRRGLIGGSGDVTSTADRASRIVQQYAASIAVVRDIFGDMGQPNAPMAELMRGLDALTRGGVGVYDPARLARTAAEFRASFGPGGLSPYNYAQATQFEQLGAGFAQAYGADRRLQFGGAFAARDAMAGYMRAFAGGPPTGELLTPDEYVNEAVRLQAAFKTSPYANAVGAAIVLGRYAPAESDFGRLAAGLAAGQNRVTMADGRTVDFNTLQQSDLDLLASQAGLGAGRFAQQLQFARSNQLALAANPETLRLQTSAQRAELIQTLQGAAGAAGFGDDVIRGFVANMQSRDVRNIDDAVIKTAQQFGLSTDRAALLGTTVRLAGLRANANDDVALADRLRITSEAAQASIGGFQTGEIDPRIKAIFDTQDKARGTPVMRMAEMLRFFGTPGAQDAAAAFGGVAGPATLRPEALPQSDFLLQLMKAAVGAVSNSAIPGDTRAALGQAGASGTVKVELANPSLTIRLEDGGGRLRATGTAVPSGGVAGFSGGLGYPR